MRHNNITYDSFNKRRWIHILGTPSHTHNINRIISIFSSDLWPEEKIN